MALTRRQRVALINAGKRRRVAKDITSYKQLAASPTDLGTAAAGASLTALPLPANARLALSVDTATTTGDITVTIGDHTINIRGGDAGALQPLGFHERGQEVVVNNVSATGALTLYVLDDWSRPTAIATGTLS